MGMIRRIALALVIIGAINWGLIGLFRFDLVAAIFGGQTAALSRIVYSLVGLSGLICLTLLFEPMTKEATNTNTDTETNQPRVGKLNFGTEFAEETDITTIASGANIEKRSNQGSSNTEE